MYSTRGLVRVGGLGLGSDPPGQHAPLVVNIPCTRPSVMKLKRVE